MIEYKTLFFDAGKQIDGLAQFDELVNKAIQSGWTPQGGIHTVGSSIYISMTREVSKTLLESTKSKSF